MKPGNRLPEDPRYRNKVFHADSAAQYLSEYRKGLAAALASVDGSVLNLVHTEMIRVIEERRLLLAGGNGGSAAIAEQLSCDWMKSTRVPGGKVLRVIGLSNNVALGSAIANDFGFQYIFSQQLAMYADKGDLVVLISSSGNSPNIVEAARYCLDHGLTLVGLSGFDGGQLAKMAHLSLHVDAYNYGLVEDAHQALTHVLAQFLADVRDRAQPD